MIRNMKIVQRHRSKGKEYGKDQSSSRGKAIQTSFEIPPVLPALVISAIVCNFIMSTIESTAAILPVIGLVAFALSGFEALLALFAPRSSASRYDIAAAFAVVSAVAAALSGSKHISSVLGLKIVH